MLRSLIVIMVSVISIGHIFAQDYRDTATSSKSITAQSAPTISHYDTGSAVNFDSNRDGNALYDENGAATLNLAHISIRDTIWVELTDESNMSNVIAIFAVLVALISGYFAYSTYRKSQWPVVTIYCPKSNSGQCPTKWQNHSDNHARALALATVVINHRKVAFPDGSRYNGEQTRNIFAHTPPGEGHLDLPRILAINGFISTADPTSEDAERKSRNFLDSNTVVVTLQCLAINYFASIAKFRKKSAIQPIGQWYWKAGEGWILNITPTVYDLHNESPKLPIQRFVPELKKLKGDILG